ncbi:MAG: hypothetical protein KDA93_16505 [Planctomycetaceae bacterium]|nr:hypothetical protein [Planctomycetaceae bacterium]
MRHFAFNSLNDTGWLVMLVVTVIVCVACIGLLSRYERRLVERRLGLTLLVLRLAVVAAVFLTLLEPVITWTMDRTETGRVLISLDVSDSMSTVDKQATQGERLRWLRAMNMIGNDSVDARLDRWQEAFDDDREPEWVDEGEANSATEREELASARRQQLNEMMESLEQTPRREVARRLISNGPSSLQKELTELAQVEMQVFAGKSELADEATLTELTDSPSDSLQTGTSDLMTGVTSTGGDDTAGPLAGIVLFTDGQDNAALDTERLLARARNLPVPVYPVMIGSERRPKDLAIGELSYPEMIYENDAAQLTAQIRTPGFDGEEVTVTLEPIDAPEHAQTQTMLTTDRSLDVEFKLDATQIGRRQYVLRVEPQAGETREDNNEKPFSVNVIDDDTRVLLLEGIARWEFRFLDNALSRDPHVEVDKIVYHQPYLGVLPETFFPRALPLPADGDGDVESPFANYDAVIVGDISPNDLPERGWTLLEQFVQEEGGTVVLTAGKHHFPKEFELPLVDQLLPVERVREIEEPGRHEQQPPMVRGFHLTLTPEGAREQFLQFDADRNENNRIWDSLPGHSWGLAGRAKPSATVLASLRDETGQGGLDFERQNAMIVQQHVGAGQVLWIGIDSTWRWRHRAGDQYHHLFWGQIARWAAKFKASAGNEHVRFGPERAEIALGEDALIRARWNQRFLNEFPNLEARAEFYSLQGEPGSRPVLTIPLKPTDSRTFIHEGTATGLLAGEYRVELHVDHADLGDETVSAELVVIETPTTELAELAANRDLLQQLADATGGRLFLPDEVDEIPVLFTDVTEHETSQEEIALWDHWLVLLLCFALLTTEWVLRKLNGLP